MVGVRAAGSKWSKLVTLSPKGPIHTVVFVVVFPEVVQGTICASVNGAPDGDV